MDTTYKTIWQQAAGDTDRDYAERHAAHAGGCGMHTGIGILTVSRIHHGRGLSGHPGPFRAALPARLASGRLLLCVGAKPIEIRLPGNAN
jgi:hypothetical protein